MESVQRVKLAHGERQYGEAWRVNNEMTGHKRTKEGQGPPQQSCLAVD